MVFAEKTTDTGFEYYTEDVFGKLWIYSTQRIPCDTLDDMVVLILKRGGNAEYVNGEVKVSEDHVVSYHYRRAPTWIDEEEEARCENSFTSTQRRGVASILMTPITRLRRGIRSIQRFVAAFREAWNRK